MPAEVQACRVAIAGASSLVGKELKQLLEEDHFPAAEIRLLDEDVAAGTLAEAGGEPVIVRAVSEESFERVRIAFFAGNRTFAARHGGTALRAGATVIDLSGGLAGSPLARRWIPALDALLPQPPADPASGQVYLAPAAPTIVACSLAAALADIPVERLAIVFFQPVSERGQAGVEELESQTVKLLSFQPIAQEVFDAQVAFNLLDRYGEASEERLSDARTRIARDVREYLAGRAMLPAIQLLHAPVFHAHAFTAYAEFSSPPDPGLLERALGRAGVKVLKSSEPAPSNVSVAGEGRVVMGPMERDPNLERGCWFWGAADNLRLAAANAVNIAEKLLAG